MITQRSCDWAASLSTHEPQRSGAVGTSSLGTKSALMNDGLNKRSTDHHRPKLEIFSYNRMLMRLCNNCYETMVKFKFNWRFCKARATIFYIVSSVPLPSVVHWDWKREYKKSPKTQGKAKKIEWLLDPYLTNQSFSLIILSICQSTPNTFFCYPILITIICWLHLTI